MFSCSYKNDTLKNFAFLILGNLELYTRKVCQMFVYKHAKMVEIKKKKEIQILRVNNSRILTIKNAKFSEYYFYMNLNILGDFQFCISVPLTGN